MFIFVHRQTKNANHKQINEYDIIGRYKIKQEKKKVNKNANISANMKQINKVDMKERYTFNQLTS